MEPNKNGVMNVPQRKAIEKIIHDKFHRLIADEQERDGETAERLKEQVKKELGFYAIDQKIVMLEGQKKKLEEQRTKLGFTGADSECRSNSVTFLATAPRRGHMESAPVHPGIPHHPRGAVGRDRNTDNLRTVASSPPMWRVRAVLNAANRSISFAIILSFLAVSLSVAILRLLRFSINPASLFQVGSSSVGSITGTHH